MDEACEGGEGTKGFRAKGGEELAGSEFVDVEAGRDGEVCGGVEGLGVSGARMRGGNVVTIFVWTGVANGKSEIEQV